MAGQTLIPAGDFRTTYAADTTVFPTTTSRNALIAGIVLICFAPHILNEYSLSLLIQIGYLGIAAGTRPGWVREVVDLVVGELARIRQRLHRQHANPLRVRARLRCLRRRDFHLRGGAMPRTEKLERVELLVGDPDAGQQSSLGL